MSKIYLRFSDDGEGKTILPTAIAKDPRVQKFLGEVDEVVKEIQTSCNHENSKNTFGRHDHTDVRSKDCEDCGFVQHRPEGKPHELCTSCWSPMIEVPEQDNPNWRESEEVGWPRINFQCTNCTNTAYHKEAAKAEP